MKEELDSLAFLVSAYLATGVVVAGACEGVCLKLQGPPPEGCQSSPIIAVVALWPLVLFLAAANLAIRFIALSASIVSGAISGFLKIGGETHE